MKNITVNYLHLCDAASSDSLGRVSILNIFTRFKFESVPTKYPRLCVVGNFTINVKSLSTNGNKLELKIFDPKGKVVEINPSVVVNLPSKFSEQAKTGELNIILDVSNLDINEFGEYHIKIFFNNEEILSKPLIVEQNK